MTLRRSGVSRLTSFFCWLFGMGLLLAALPCVASGALRLDGSAARVQLSGHVTWLDVPARMTPPEVASADAAGRLSRKDGSPLRGFSPHPQWLRIDLVRLPDAPTLWMLTVGPSYLDDVRLFIAGSGVELLSGETMPPERRAFRGVLPAFPLSLPDGASVVYVRIASSSSIVVDAELATPAAYAEQLGAQALGQGVYLGIELLLLLVGAGLWWHTRSRLLLLYAGFVGFEILQFAATNGLVAEYLLPGMNSFTDRLQGLLQGPTGLVRVLFLCEVLRGRLGRTTAQALCWGTGLLAGAAVLSAYTPLYIHVAPLVLAGYALSNLVWIDHGLRQLFSPGSEGRLRGFALVVFALLVYAGVFAGLGWVDLPAWSVQGGRYASLVYCTAFLLHIVLRLRQDAAALTAARQDTENERRLRQNQAQFIAMLTHEIRTPVSVIDAAAHSLELLDMRTTPERRQRYERLHKAVQRISALTHACFVGMLGDDGQRPLQLARVSLQQVVRDAAGHLSPAVQARIRWHDAPPLPPVLADLPLLETAFLNLLDNAGKYSPEGSLIEVHLVAQAHRGTAGVLCRVADRGAGPADGDYARLFARYVRGTPAADVPGLGLGLHLARGLLERHGAWVQGAARAGGGSEFAAWVPAAQAPAPGATRLRRPDAVEALP